MKIKSTNLKHSILVGALVLGAGMYGVNSGVKNFIYKADASTTNTISPATTDQNEINATINFDDANLKTELVKALNLPEGSDITIQQARRLRVFRSSTAFTSLEGIQYFTNLDNLHLTGINSTYNDISMISSLTALEVLTLENNQATDPSSIASLPLIRQVRLVNTRIRDWSSLGNINLSGNNRTLHIGQNEITQEEFNRILDNPNGFNHLGVNAGLIYDLSKIGTSAGVRRIVAGSQRHSMDAGYNNSIIANPIKDAKGQVVQIIETAEVINSDADGTPNPNGNFIKITPANTAGTINVQWAKVLNMADNGVVASGAGFSGTLSITYLFDKQAPTINQQNLTPIVSRKGTTININDVTAVDEGNQPSGLKSLTNNATNINLNATNPEAGDYTITYTAIDNAGNSSTATRTIEITDADELTRRIEQFEKTDYSKYTEQTREALRQAVEAGKRIADNNSSTQDEIDDATLKIQVALDNLRADKTPIVNAINNHDNSEDWIKNIPGVKSAFNKATEVNNAENPSIQDIETSAKNLNDEINRVKQEEQTRQNEAEKLLNEAKKQLTPNSFKDAQDQIDALLDPVAKKKLQDELNELKKTYDEKKLELQNLIEKVKKIDTNGLTEDTIKELDNQLTNAETTEGEQNATQTSIEEVIEKLQKAIDDLRADKTPLETAVSVFDKLDEDLKQDEELLKLVQEANDILDAENPTVEEIKLKTEELLKAMEQKVEAKKLAELKRLAEEEARKKREEEEARKAAELAFRAPNTGHAQQANQGTIIAIIAGFATLLVATVAALFFKKKSNKK